MRSKRSKHTPIPTYEIDNGHLVLERERVLLHELLKGSPYLQSYSSETRDWLRCQVLMNRLLASIVNGDMSFSTFRLADWLYRFIYPEPTLWRERLRFEKTGPYTRRLQKYFSKRWAAARSLCAALKEAEQFLLEPPKEIFAEKLHYTVKSQPPQPRNHPVVNELRRRLKPLESNVSVYVHGSMASGDYTVFSDVDDLVIIHCSSWASYKQFRRVIRLLERTAKLFQCVDPLQHHGHWVFLDFDLSCLDQTTMPLVVLDNANVIVGGHSIEAKVQNGTWGFASIMWAMAQEIRRDAQSMMRGRLNLYGLKNLISSISLLPALVFQLQGKMLDKKTAILRSEEIFSDQPLSAIRWTTEVRKVTCPGYGWVQTMRHLNRILPFRRSSLEKLARDYLPVLQAGQIPFLTEEVICGIFRLTDECTHQLEEILRNQKES